MEFQLGCLCQERLWEEVALEPGLEELGVFLTHRNEVAAEGTGVSKETKEGRIGQDCSL